MTLRLCFYNDRLVCERLNRHLKVIFHTLDSWFPQSTKMGGSLRDVFPLNVVAATEFINGSLCDLIWKEDITLFQLSVCTH